MVQAIIFDLDGVICFTDHYHYLAWKTVADEIGAHFDEQINNRLRGVSRMASLEIILEKYDGTLTQGEKEALAEKKNGVYRSLLTQMTTEDLPEAVATTLHQLREMGLKLAIGSSSKNTPLILEKLGLAHFFDAVADGNDITHSKPDPEVFLCAAKKLGILPEACLVVEDAEAGAQAARAGGMRCACLGDAAICGAGDWQMKDIQELLDVVRQAD